MSFGWSASAAQAAPSSGPAASRAARGRAMSGLGCSGSGTGAASTGALGARLAATPARCRRDRRRSALVAWRAPPSDPAPRAAGRRGREVIPRATVGPTPSPRGRLRRARTVTGETFAGDPAALLADVRAGQFRRLRSRELNEALQYLGRGANWRLVYDVFDQLVEPDPDPDRPQGAFLPPNAHVATTVLSIAGRKGDLGRVRSIFEWMRAQGPGRSAPTAYTYTAYIQAVGAAGRWREAFTVYRDMRAAGVSPTTHTYSALIRGAAKGGKVGANAAAALVEDMRLDGISPDVPIASALICAYGVAGPVTNAERMLRAVEAVTAKAYANDAEAVAEAGEGRASGGGASSVSGTSRRSRGGRRPDAKLYTEFLIAACRCGRPGRGGGGFRIGGFPADDVHVHGGDQSVRRVRRVGQGGGAVRADDGRGGRRGAHGASRASPCSRRTKSAAVGTRGGVFVSGSTRARRRGGGGEGPHGRRPSRPSRVGMELWRRGRGGVALQHRDVRVREVRGVARGGPAVSRDARERRDADVRHVQHPHRRVWTRGEGARANRRFRR